MEKQYLTNEQTEALAKRIKKTTGTVKTVKKPNHYAVYIDGNLFDAIPTDGTHKDRHPITLDALDEE